MYDLKPPADVLTPTAAQGYRAEEEEEEEEGEEAYMILLIS